MALAARGAGIAIPTRLWASCVARRVRTRACTRRARRARARVTARCKCIFDRSSCLEIIHRISLYEFQNVETAGQPLQPGASPILFWPERSQNFARKASKHQAVAAPAMPATRARRRPSGRRRGGKPPQRRKANPPQRRLVAQRQWIPPAPVCRVQLDWCPTCQMPLWRSHSACCKLHSEEEEQAAATAAAAATLADEKQAAATAAAAAASKLAEEEQAVVPAVAPRTNKPPSHSSRGSNPCATSSTFTDCN